MDCAQSGRKCLGSMNQINRWSTNPFLPEAWGRFQKTLQKCRPVVAEGTEQTLRPEPIVKPSPTTPRTLSPAGRARTCNSRALRHTPRTPFHVANEGGV